MEKIRTGPVPMLLVGAVSCLAIACASSGPRVTSQVDARKEIYEFTLMDIRFGPDGTGVAKIAAAGDVVYNPESKLLELKDYQTKPVRLVNVKSAKTLIARP